jgi:hypothetical protein
MNLNQLAMTCIVVGVWLVFHHPTELVLSDVHLWVPQRLHEGKYGSKEVVGEDYFSLPTMGKLFNFQKTCSFIVDWLRWGETDVSELRPLRAFCSSPGDCDVDRGWWCWLGLTPNLSTRALWQPSVLSGGTVSRDISAAAPNTGWFPASRDVSGANGRWSKGNEYLVYPFRGT